METIGKILSLTLLAIFGTAGTVIYFTDPSHSPSFLNESVSDTRNFGSETSNKIDYSAYRKRLRKNYFETEQPFEKNSEPRKQQSLWTNTYDTPSQEVRRLVEENSIGDLRENMNYWNNRYHETLRLEKKLEADEAYTRYRNYKKALEVKEAFR
ncbi:MAG: hypothetical protein HYW01_13390 [Deltaproteobacteria bacterium]|nr:hypothetical protein [Deltaproteobacteria bacterium]